MFRIFYIALIAALLFKAQGSFAQQTISGRVLTSTNEPLSGANIIIANSTLGAASNKDGNYIISKVKKGEYTLHVSFFGYQTLEQTITVMDSDVHLDFKMEETSIDLNAVVVTGTRTEKSLANTPVLTQMVTIKELQNKDVTDITQALEYVIPGLEFSSTATGKSLTLQGIDPQYMLFLVDGERLAGDTYGDIDYSRINIADIERIEVVKGAGSTLYGSNALGGVVNVITKTPSKKFGAGVSARYSNYNSRNYQLSTGSKIGNFSNQLSMVYDKTDGYDLLEGNSYRTQEKEDNLVISDHLKFMPSDKFTIEGNLSFMNKNRENTSEDLMDRRNRDFTYGIKGLWYINSINNLSISWNSDKYDIFDKTDNNELDSVYNNLYNTARLLGNFRLASWNLLTVGAEYNSENLTAARNNIGDKTNTDYILYAQEDVQFNENLNVIGGFRAHNNSEYDWHFTPQISAMYKIWHLAFRGNYSMGYKTPTLKEKYMSFRIPAPGPPMFLVGFESLEPETSNYTSLSAEYTRPGVSFSVSAYRNNIRNMISENLDEYIVKPGGIIEYSYRNYDEVLLKGIDIILKSKIIRNLYFDGAVSFSKKYNQLENEEFDNVRNFTGKFGLNHQFSRKNYQLNTNLQSNFYGAKNIDLMDEITHQVKSIELESFSIWKLTTTHTIKTNYFLKLGIDNIFDYTDSSGGYNTGTPGRTYFAAIGLNI